MASLASASISNSKACSDRSNTKIGLEDQSAYAVPDDIRTLGRQTVGDPDVKQPNILFHLLHQLTPGQDLTKVTIPAQYIEPRSLLERFTDMFLHPQLLVNADIDAKRDPIERMLAVTRWYLSGWHYETRGVKKPFNPILGESFAGFWENEDKAKSPTMFYLEQVSHRPPVTALFLHNKDAHITINGQFHTLSMFRGNYSESVMNGSVTLYMTSLREEYVITVPNIIATGLLTGTLATDTSGSSTILCPQTGVRANFSWSKRAFLSAAKPHTVAGSIETLGEYGKKVYTFSGSYKGQIHLQKIDPSALEVSSTPLQKITAIWGGGAKARRNSTAASSDLSVFLDTTQVDMKPMWTLPMDRQGPWESRRLWKSVVDLYCSSGTDWSRVNHQKELHENAQRKMDCHATGKTLGWVPKGFHLEERARFVDGVKEERWVFNELDPATGETSVTMNELFALSRKEVEDETIQTYIKEAQL